MTLKELIIFIREDLRNHSTNGFVGYLLTYFFNPSFRLILNYRIGYFLAKRRNPLVTLIILHYKRRQILIRNCDISYHATIGHHIRFPHPLGIVIGENVVVEDNVSIWQQVTLGSHGKQKGVFNYPIIKQHVRIFAGAKILGGIQVGARSVIGANAVVISDTTPGATVVGVPGKEKVKI